MGHIQALPSGTELVDDFRIEHVLGAGGFGITYLAREIALDRKVTIKEYFPADFATREGAVSAVARSEGCAPDYQWGLDRFIEEAQTLAKFDHVNIVRVYRYFRGNNTGYMVLHFEEGQSLKAWLQGLGRAPRQAELDAILAPLLDALTVVHAADFLHRDIAPDNIMIRSDGSPVLIDFGAARGDIAQHSRTVSALVKPGYSPYEQYGEIGRSQGPWTDIYALAATLYHAITGKRPPDAPSRVVNDEIRPARDAALSAYRPGFLKAIDQGLLIDIEKRPQTVAEWRGALLAPDDAAAQRSWFGGRRADKTVMIDDYGVDAAAIDLPTRAVRSRGPAMLEMPLPPDVPFQPNVPERRGRIVDFLEGGRRSPRDPTVVVAAADKVAGQLPSSASRKVQKAVAQPGLAEAGLGRVDGTPSTALPQGAKKRGRGLFAWLGAPSSASLGDRLREVQTDEQPQNAVPRAAPKIYQPPPVLRDLERPLKRKPPRPRPMRRPILWRLLPIAAKLAAGVVLAAFFVNIQQRMPHFEFSSRGTVASSVADVPRTVTGSIASASMGKKIPSVEGHTGGAIHVASSDASAFKPQVRRAPATLLLRTFEAHLGGTSAVQFTSDGALLVTVGADGTLKVWDSTSYALVRTLELEHGPAFSLAVRGTRALTGHENGRVALWDLTLGMQLKTFKRNDAAIVSLVFAGDDKFLAGANDWSVSFWEVATPSLPLHVFAGHQRNVLAIAFEPGQGLIASGSADRTVRLWDSKSLSLVRTYPNARDFVTAVAFSPDGGEVLIGTLSGDVSLYSTSSRSRRRRYHGHDGRVTSLKFLDGGREFVSASADGTVRLWNHRESRDLQTFGSEGAKISNASVSPDGRLIASGKSNGTVQIWNGVVLD